MTIAPKRFIHLPTGEPVVETGPASPEEGSMKSWVRVVRDGRPVGDPFLARGLDLAPHVPSSPFGAPEPLLPEASRSSRADADGEKSESLRPVGLAAGRFADLLRPAPSGPLAGLVEGLPPGTVLELKVVLPREAPP